MVTDTAVDIVCKIDRTLTLRKAYDITLRSEYINRIRCQVALKYIEEV